MESTFFSLGLWLRVSVRYTSVTMSMRERSYTEHSANEFLMHRSSTLFPSTDDALTVPLWKKLAYGAPQLVKMPAKMFIEVHLKPFYLGQGVALSSIAFVTAIGRSLDVLADPIMATITDCTSTTFGRRRPYIFLGSFLYALSLLILCSPPHPTVSYMVIPHSTIRRAEVVPEVIHRFLKLFLNVVGSVAG